MADEDIRIRWYAVPNENKTRGGFMPVYEKNGRVHGHTYGRGYDRDEAETLAKADAEDEASHYVGDWNVSVEKRATREGEGGFATVGAMAAIATLGAVAWFGRGLLGRRGRS